MTSFVITAVAIVIATVPTQNKIRYATVACSSAVTGGGIDAPVTIHMVKCRQLAILRARGFTYNIIHCVPILVWVLIFTKRNLGR